ncbi:MAG TPA: hypothetical protein VEQ11_09120 [Chloroflexota bacterium]|nr:hypothetical protein [Chloroflexota bacterium]
MAVVVLGLALNPPARGGSAARPPLYGLDFSPLVFFQVPGILDQARFPDAIPDSQLHALIDTIAPHTQWIRTYQTRAWGTCFFPPDSMRCAGAPNDVAPYAISKGLKVAIGVDLSGPVDLAGTCKHDVATLNFCKNEAEIGFAFQAATDHLTDLLVVANEPLTSSGLKADQALKYLGRVKNGVSNLTGPSGNHVQVTQCEITGNVVNNADNDYSNSSTIWSTWSASALPVAQPWKHDRRCTLRARRPVEAGQGLYPSAGQSKQAAKGGHHW